jgi:hypothetical protein
VNIEADGILCVPCYGEDCGLLLLLEEQPPMECCQGRHWFTEHCEITYRMTFHRDGCPTDDGPVALERTYARDSGDSHE